MAGDMELTISRKRFFWSAISLMAYMSFKENWRISEFSSGLLLDLL
jgi:hypothetical protein